MPNVLIFFLFFLWIGFFYLATYLLSKIKNIDKFIYKQTALIIFAVFFILIYNESESILWWEKGNPMIKFFQAIGATLPFFITAVLVAGIKNKFKKIFTKDFYYALSLLSIFGTFIIVINGGLTPKV